MREVFKIILQSESRSPMVRYGGASAVAYATPGERYAWAGVRSGGQWVLEVTEMDMVRVEVQNTRRKAGSGRLRTGGDGGGRCRSHGRRRVGKKALSVASLEFTLWAEVRTARVRRSVISW